MNKLLCLLGVLSTGCTYYDGGGPIVDRMYQTGYLNSLELEEFPLPPRCDSACVMFLAVHGACLLPGTILGLHGASREGEILTGSEADYWAGIYAAHLPGHLRDLYMSTARHSLDLTLVAGDALVAAGIVPACANPAGSPLIIALELP